MSNLKWLLNVTITGSITALIIFIVRSVFKDKLTPKWKYYIWFILVIRLLIPALPESNLSIFQYVPEEAVTNSIDKNIIANPEGPIVTQTTPNSSNDSKLVADQSKNAVNHKLTLNKIIAYIYYSCIIIILLYYISIYFALHSKLKRLPTYENIETLEIFKKVKTELGIKRKIKILCGSKPMLVGIINPILVLPEGYSDKETAAVLIHELMHYKYKDIAINWLITLLKCVYFFNPIFWYAFTTMRRDCELACDQRVLEFGGVDKATYARVLFKEALVKNKYMVGTSSIANGKNEITKRVKFIERFKKPKTIWILIGAAIATIVTITTLTNSKSVPKEPLAAKIYIEDNTLTNSKSLPKEPPAAKLYIEDNGGALEYIVLKNEWNGALYDRASDYQALSKKYKNTSPIVCKKDSKIVIDFGKNQPDTLKLKMQTWVLGDNIDSEREPVDISIEKENNAYSFIHKYTWSEYGFIMRFYCLTAKWGGDSVDYAFAIGEGDNSAITNKNSEWEKLSFMYNVYNTPNGERRQKYFVAYKNGKVALLDENKKVLLPPEFEGFEILYNLIGAKKDGKWGLYDKKSLKLVVDHSWEEIYDPPMPDDCKANGLVRIKTGGVWGCIDQTGKIIIKPNWDGIDINYYEEVEPYVRVRKNGKYGYVTYTGKIILEPVWDAACMDVLNKPKNLIYVKKGDKWGGVKIKNDRASSVNWNIEPSDEI